jgi:hypothetical protein
MVLHWYFLFWYAYGMGMSAAYPTQQACYAALTQQVMTTPAMATAHYEPAGLCFQGVAAFKSQHPMTIEPFMKKFLAKP